MRWVSPDRADPEEEKLEQLGAEIINDEPEIPDETQGLVDNPSYIDNDDQWSDTAEHLDSDIRDIIITGKVRLAFSPWSPDPGFASLSALGCGVRNLGFHPLPCLVRFPDQVSRDYTKNEY